MLKVISQSLRQLADDVDEGKFECSKEQMAEVVTQLAEFILNSYQKRRLVII